MRETNEQPTDDHVQVFLNIWSLKYIRKVDFDAELETLIKFNSGFLSKTQPFYEMTPNDNNSGPSIPQLNWISNDKQIRRIMATLDRIMLERFNRFQLFPLCLVYGTDMTQELISEVHAINKRTLERLVRTSKDVALNVIKSGGNSKP